MQTRRGGIENGAVVLIPEGEQVVHATDEELAIIDAGLAAAQEPQRIDARAFLRELRLGR
jgi:hypothetical protein